MPVERVTFEVIHNHPSGELKFWRHDLAAAFLNCQQLGIVADRWIPVGERLPDDGQRVLAHCDGRVFTADLFEGMWHWIEGKMMNTPVDHWMPLPEPPEKK